MRITFALNQDASYEALNPGTAGWGDPTYAAPITIKVRRTLKRKYKKTSDLLEHEERSEYLTEQPVNVGDYLDGEEVRAVESITALTGETIAYKAFHTPPASFA